MTAIYLLITVSNLILSLYGGYYLWLNALNWPISIILLAIEITLLFNTYFFFRQTKLRISKWREIRTSLKSEE